MTAGEALGRILSGSGYVARQVGPSAWRIEAAPPPRPARPRPQLSAPPVPDAPIVVTATKRPLPLADVPLSVSIVSFAGDDNSSSRDTQSIAEALPAITLTDMGPGRNRIFLRGVSDSPFTGNTQSTVAVLLDESRVTYSAPDPDFLLIDTDRVEVLKGPQGSLYGTGTLGGVYHIVTRAPVLDDLQGIVSAGATSMAHGGVGTQASGVINLPVLPGKGALRLVAYNVDEPGWIDTGTRENSNESRIHGGRARLRIETDADWNGDVSGAIQRLETGDSQYVYAPHARQRAGQLPEPHDNDFSHVAMRLGGPVGAMRLQLMSGYTWHEVTDVLDASAAASEQGLAGPTTFSDDRFYRIWDSEIRLTGHFGRIGWLLGASHIEASQRSNQMLAEIAAGGSSVQLAGSFRQSRDSALFGEITLPSGRNFEVTAGARLFHGSARDRIGITTTDSFVRHGDRIGLTPTVALSWKSGDKRLFYLRYGSAIRQGGLEIEAKQGSHVVEGDELATIEAGWRESFGGGGRAEISLFSTWWENVQSDTLLANGLIEARNAGDARIYGAEASLAMPFARSWQFEASGIFQHTRLTRNALGISLEDKRLPVVPDYAARLGVLHTFVLGGVNASASGGLRYVGPSRLSFDPVLDRAMGDYAEAAVELDFEFSRWDAKLRATNLFGAKGNSFAYGNPFRVTDEPQYTPVEPAKLILELTKSF